MSGILPANAAHRLLGGRLVIVRCGHVQACAAAVYSVNPVETFDQVAIALLPGAFREYSNAPY